MESGNQLTNVQTELLKLFSYNLPDEELLEVKKLLARFFAEKASNEVDKLWVKNSWTQETMDSWLKD